MNSRCIWPCILLGALFSIVWLLTANAVLAQSALPSASQVTAEARRAEVIPPVPTHWFSDYAKITSPIFAIELDRHLEQFEHETTNQFIVVIFPKLQSDAPIGDYCRRVAGAWGVGQKGVNNGCVLFVFTENHELYLRAGSGLQPALDDAACEQIVKQIAAIFHQGDLEKGVTTGVDAVIKTLQAQPLHRTAP